MQCGEESHAPVGCEQLSQWLQKCKNESETAHWIIANTRKCPKCSIRIEKNQGCNHVSRTISKRFWCGFELVLIVLNVCFCFLPQMTCRGCKFEWCWVCMGDWQQHGNQTGGYYKCFGPDTRVLTSDGFLFEPQIAAALADGNRREPLLFACYDRQAEAFVYRSGQMVYPENTAKKLVTFDDGDVLLRVTPEHDMYVQVSTAGRTSTAKEAEDGGEETDDDDRGVSDEEKSRFEWEKETVAGKPVLVAPTKRTAQTLLSDFTEKGIRFQAAAATGVVHTVAELPFVVQFGLQTLEQVDAFLEFYGFWLGNGTITLDSSWHGVNGLGLHLAKQSDIDFLRDVLPKCGFRADEWQDRNGWIIATRSSWFAAFEGKYGKEHPNSTHPSAVAWAKSAKRLFWWVLERLNARQCRLLLRGLWRTDDSWSTQRQWIQTSSTSFRDELSALLLHCGYTSRFSSQKEASIVSGSSADAQSWGGEPLIVTAAGISETVAVENWMVDWSEATSAQGEAACYPAFDGANIRTEAYDGAVWCVRVEHKDHLIVAQGTEMKDGRVIRAGRSLIVGQCNRWDPKAEAATVKGSPEEAKAELNRYLHYYQRYHNHDQSKRFAEKQKVQTEKRMATLHAQSGGDAAWIDFQFMAAATQQVLEVRQEDSQQEIV